MSTARQRLDELGLVLPPVTKPVGAYVPALRHGDLLLLSGQIPLRDGAVAYTGRVGSSGRTLEDAQAAARLCTLNALAIAADAAGGLERIARVVKVAKGWVPASVPSLTHSCGPLVPSFARK